MGLLTGDALVWRFVFVEVLGTLRGSVPSLVAMVVALSLQSFVVPLRSARLLDDVSGCEGESCGAHWERDLLGAVRSIGWCQCVAILCRALERRLSETRSKRSKATLRKRCFERVLRLDDACFETLRTGELLSTLSEPGASWIICEGVPSLLRAAFALVRPGALLGLRLRLRRASRPRQPVSESSRVGGSRARRP